MQILLILGLFGSIYMVISVMIASVADTAVTINEQRGKDIHQMFSDIQFAIVEGYLGDNPSLVGAPTDLDDPDFIKPYLSWKGSDLVTDPWMSPIVYSMDTEEKNLYSNTNGSTIVAPVHAILLFSNGRNGVNDSGALPTDFDDIQSFEVADGSDDIAYTFTTIDAAYNLVNRIVEVMDRLESAQATQYKAQYEHFTDDIINYYEGRMASGGTFNFGDTAWLTANWSSVAGQYPSFATTISALGIEGELDRLPQDLVSTIAPVSFTALQSNASTGGAYEVEMRLVTKAAHTASQTVIDSTMKGWKVNMTYTVRAADILIQP